jgi:putative transposase
MPKCLAERVNGILKHEFLIEMPNDVEQARKMIDESIKTYNAYSPMQCIGRL